MGVNSCCVCKNNSKNSKCSFYRFPARKYKIDQRTKWIDAIKLKNADGSKWSPKPHHRICSAHFKGNKKTENPFSPSYVPTIFSHVDQTIILEQQEALNRHNRFMKNVEDFIKETDNMIVKEQIEMISQIVIEEPNKNEQIDKIYMDQGCQVDFVQNSFSLEKTFFCTRYVYGGEKCDVEIQTEVCVALEKIIIPNHKR